MKTLFHRFFFYVEIIKPGDVKMQPDQRGSEDVKNVLPRFEGVGGGWRCSLFFVPRYLSQLFEESPGKKRNVSPKRALASLLKKLISSYIKRRHLHFFMLVGSKQGDGPSNTNSNNRDITAILLTLETTFQSFFEKPHIIQHTQFWCKTVVGNRSLTSNVACPIQKRCAEFKYRCRCVISPRFYFRQKMVSFQYILE